MNSTSTLRSLSLESSPYASSFLEDWENVSADNAFAKQKHTLTALKSLSLSGLSFDAASLKSLDEAIDIMGLRELTLGYLSKGANFFQHLTDLATSTQKSARKINLRSLSLDMANGYSLGQSQANFDTQCRFISSFDTLTTLELKDCNLYPTGFANDPELTNVLVQAILKHKNLRTLKIWYHGIISNLNVPYLSASSVATIVDNLPQLEYFEFAPEETQIIGQFPLFCT
jgi:hypothetical protein